MCGEGLTTGQLAKRVAMNIETIRFYERSGILPKPPRNASGYRLYPLDAVNHLLFVRRAKSLGFSLKEIEEIFAIRVDPNADCGEVKRIAEKKLAEIDGKLRSLTKMRNALKVITDACTGDGPTESCVILEALQAEEFGLYGSVEE